ncbi:MAG: hypothetical protein AAF702_37905 [Chloroflexota bacterium]
MIALLTLFIPQEAAALYRRLQRWFASYSEDARTWLQVGLALVLLLMAQRAALFVLLAGNAGEVMAEGASERGFYLALAPQLLWWFLAPLFGVAFGWVWLRVRQAPAPSLPWRTPYVGLMVLPLLLFFNGLTPYLGLKTLTTFSMYSNLHTEAGETNHFVVPVTWQRWGFQQDVVEIVASEHEVLEETRTNEYALIYSSFRHLTNGLARDIAVDSPTEHFAVAYRHNGVAQRKTLSADAVEPFTLVRYLERKLLPMRPVDLRPTTRCAN